MAFGLRRARNLGRVHANVNEYAHDSGDSVALFIGDPVVTTGTSTNAVALINDGTPIVAASGTITTTAIRGFVEGVRVNGGNLTLQYCPASVNLAILVCDDPNVTVEIQDDGTAAVGDVSGNIAITSGAGIIQTGVSAYVAHEASLGSTNVLRILRLAPIVNNTMGANAVLECSINAHELKNTSGT